MPDTLAPPRIDPPASEPQPPSASSTRARTWPGYAGFGWALSYLPIHLYWAAGGTTDWLGIHTVDATFALGDVTACIVLVGAGLTCLSLVQPWGRLLPRVLRHGLAWVGGVFGIVHALLFGVTALLRMGAVLPYPHSTGAGVTVTELRHFDLANVLYFEPWFAIMGALLIGTSLHAGRRRLGEPTTSAPTAWLPTVLLMAGVCAVVAGTFTFQVWLFAGPDRYW